MSRQTETDPRGVGIETHYSRALMTRRYSGDNAEMVILVTAEAIGMNWALPPHRHGSPQIIDVVFSKEPPRLSITVAWKLTGGK